MDPSEWVSYVCANDIGWGYPMSDFETKCCPYRRLQLTWPSVEVLVHLEATLILESYSLVRIDFEQSNVRTMAVNEDLTCRVTVTFAARQRSGHASIFLAACGRTAPSFRSCLHRAVGLILQRASRSRRSTQASPSSASARSSESTLLTSDSRNPRWRRAEKTLACASMRRGMSGSP
jgi:hypothetical protein